MKETGDDGGGIAVHRDHGTEEAPLTQNLAGILKNGKLDVIMIAWRLGFTRPQVIDVIRWTVHALKVPGPKMVTE